MSCMVVSINAVTLSTKTPTHAAVVYTHARRHDNSAFLYSKVFPDGKDTSALSGSVQKYERLQL